MSAPAAKDPCPWRTWCERSKCQCFRCERALLRVVLEASRGVKYKTKALKLAIAELDRRMQK